MRRFSLLIFVTTTLETNMTDAIKQYTWIGCETLNLDLHNRAWLISFGSRRTKVVRVDGHHNGLQWCAKNGQAILQFRI